MISVMEQENIDNAAAIAAAGGDASAAAGAGDNGTGAADQGLTGFHGIVGKVESVGKSVIDAVETAGKSAIDAVETVGKSAIDTVTGDARALAMEAMRKLGAVHVALDKLDAFAAGEIQNARENVASAIVSVARHLAG